MLVCFGKFSIKKGKLQNSQTAPYIYERLTLNHMSSRKQYGV